MMIRIWITELLSIYCLSSIVTWDTNLRTLPKKIGMLLKELGRQFCCQLSNIYAKFQLHYHFLP